MLIVKQTTHGSLEYRTPFKKDHGKITLVLYTKPSPCGGECLYCISEDGFTKSTIANEDTLLARTNNWNPVKQLRERVRRYGIERGIGNKFGISVKGDSFTNHDRRYLVNYFKSIYDYLNGTVSNSFEEAKELQKHAPDRSVRTLVETRPDQIDEEWCTFLLKLGVSIVEIGVQSLDDAVLALNNRGHGVEAVIRATSLLRRHGFQVGFQLMVGLVGSNIELDFKMLTQRLWESDLCPDAIKIYPCILLRDLRLQEQLIRHVNSDWIPFTDESYIDFLKQCLPHIPPYVYVGRIQRIFEPSDIALGPKKIIDRTLFSGICKCLWHRSIMQSGIDLDGDFTNFGIRSYPQGDGFCIEAFVGNVVIGYGRLSFNDDNRAVIRDVRVLGNMLPVGFRNETCRGTQHIGIGKSMMKHMEELAKERCSQDIIIHSPDGVVSYFENLGYEHIQGTEYLRKPLLT